MIHFATEQNANMRQQSVRDSGATVRDVLESFEAWCDRQTFPPAIALHANHVLGYLRMAEHGQLTPGCRANLAAHVAAINEWRL